MKKLAVLSIALLMLTTLVFAEVMVEPVVEFSGSGTLTWGIDLDTTANHGFLNESSANLTVTLVAASTETKGMMMEGEMVYGYISLSDMSLILDSDGTATVPADMAIVDADGDGAADAGTAVEAPDTDTLTLATPFVTAPTVEAYVMLGPAKWFIYAAPDLAVTFAAALEDESADDDVNNWAEDEETDDVAPDFGEGATGVEFAAGPVTIAALIASATDWTDGPAAYGVGVTVALDLAPITVNAGMNYPFATGSAFGFGASLGLALDPLTVSAAFDMTTATGTPMEITGGVALALPDVLDLTANVAYGAAGGVATWGLDAEVGVSLTAVPDLTFSALVGLWDITPALEWGIMVDAGYKIAMGEVNYVKPAVTAYISTADVTEGNEMRIALVASLTAVLIPNTTFVLTFDDADLTDSNAFAGTDRTLTFATTVEY
jgi:hypothetical protein